MQACVRFVVCARARVPLRRAVRDPRCDYVCDEGMRFRLRVEEMRQSALGHVSAYGTDERLLLY